MFQRQLNILKSNAFFLFGARGVGKTFLLKELFKSERALWINLLEFKEESFYLEDPDRLSAVIKKNQGKFEWVVIDEIQKIPKLLDVVHHEIEEHGTKFALTGSSARKLKRGSANLLAGRAFVYHLFPLTYSEIYSELGLKADLMEILQFGSLPKLYDYDTVEEKSLYLDTYVETYLKEEIFAEQLTRNIVPFRKFLGVSAQSNGTIVNFSKISHELGIDDKTVKTYFEILEDTLVAFMLPASERSFRKQLIKSPKFFLFDCGVKRAIEGLSRFPLQTSQDIGPAFEHFVITEIYRSNIYQRKKFKLSYLQTKSGLEVDLILTPPRGEDILIEIKSATKVNSSHLSKIKMIKADFPKCRAICICREQHIRELDSVEIVPWTEALSQLDLG